MIYPHYSYASRDSIVLSCPKLHCRAVELGPKVRRHVRHGSYYRSSDRRKVPRYLCRNCETTFSDATFDPAFGQKKRQLNFAIWKDFDSVVNLRRVARRFRISRSTVDRKLRFLGEEARLELEYFNRK